MIRESFPQYAIVQEDTAERLTDSLNSVLIDLRRKNPVVTFEGLIARVSYTERFEAPETLAEEYEQKGVRLTCQDCPYFTPVLKADGTEDKRIKLGDCPFCHYERTYKDTAACDQLFRAINSGEVKLCLAE